MTRLLGRFGPVARRVVARWIDLVIVGWVAVLALELIDGTVGALVGLAVLVGFEAAATWWWGRTPGKALLGLELAGPHGARLPRWSPGVRPMVLYASFAVPWAYWVPMWTGVLVIWMVLAPGGRVLHDLVARSTVVRTG